MSSIELLVGPWNTSSQSLSAWLALQAAGLRFETLRLDTADPEVAKQITEWSPSGRLPVLRYDGEPVAWELWAIFELAAEHDPGLWPGDPAERVRARSIAAEALGLTAFQTFLPMDFAGRFAPPAQLLRSAARQADRLRAIWSECRKQAEKAGPFLFGRFGLVDAAMVPLAARFRTYALPMEPIVQAYVEALLSLDAVLAWERLAVAERGTVPEAGVTVPTHPVGTAGTAAPPPSDASAPAEAAVRSESAEQLAMEDGRQSAAAFGGNSPVAPPAAAAATGDAETAPPVDVVPSTEARAARRPVFSGGLFRRRPVATPVGTEPLQPPPSSASAPQPETLRPLADGSGARPAQDSGSRPREVVRSPAVKPIGVAARRRR